MVDRQTSSAEACRQSKTVGERMAQEMMRTDRNKPLISVRCGWVNTDDRSGAAWYRKVWLGHRDTCPFIARILQGPSQICEFDCAVSNSHCLWLDWNHSRNDVNFTPQVGAENMPKNVKSQLAFLVVSIEIR